MTYKIEDFYTLNILDCTSMIDDIANENTDIDSFEEKEDLMKALAIRYGCKIPTEEEFDKVGLFFELSSTIDDLTEQLNISSSKYSVFILVLSCAEGKVKEDIERFMKKNFN